ncbi:MAG: polysaccharide deacetylase family protein [Planctomycetota bacterium]|jgi:peptidoglycan/xylan/chitin deacetylase (PgdA/CDA1 family)
MSMDRAEDPLFVALTVDVDPDANRPRAGRPDAVSAGHGEGVALGACFEGLSALAALLGERCLPAAFFWEGRALRELSARQPDLLGRLRAGAAFEHGCHGHRHEDFAGRDSGMPLDVAATRQVLREAGHAFEAAFGTAPRAFRAPYCRLTPALKGVLAEMGYLYDASITRCPSAGWRMRPYRLADSPELWELALCRWADRRGGPISAYLWQMFEGKRRPRDYAQMVADLAGRFGGGLLQIALHPWHLMVGADGRPLAEPGGPAPLARLRELLSAIAETQSVAFTGASAYLMRALGGSAAERPPR